MQEYAPSQQLIATSVNKHDTHHNIVIILMFTRQSTANFLRTNCCQPTYYCHSFLKQSQSKIRKSERSAQTSI